MTSFQCNMFDVENELEQFSIRKKNAINEKTTGSSTFKNVNSQSVMKTHEFVPLLICDVLTLDQSQFMNKVFNVFSVPCKGFILCARIVGRSPENEAYYKYSIDDGTGVIEMSIFKQGKDLETITKLENEVNCFERMATAQDKWQSSNCLRRLLTKSKQDMNFSNINIGTKVLIYCKPSIFKNQIGVKAFSIFKDEELVHNLEIEFKDLMIRWHRCNQLNKNNIF